MAAANGSPKGVAVQVHAYVSSPPAQPDNSALRVRDGKQIEIVGGPTGETLNIALDHVYQQATEGDVMERSLRSLTAACVEGVNVSLLAVGSAKSQKSRVLFSPMPEQSLAASVFQTLLDLLQSKMATLNSSNSIAGSGAAASSGLTSARRNQSLLSATFSIRMSFVELYEESITDLLVDDNRGNQVLSIEDDPETGKTIRNLSQSLPLPSVGNFRRLMESGLSSRRSFNGLYGNATEFSSAILRIFVTQIFAFHDAPAQELHSVFEVVDLPTTNRLARPGASVRLSEGPLLNKSLFALLEVIQGLANVKQVDYQVSHLTTLLQDALGGNCLTLVLMCLSPGDLEGSTATLQLGRLLPQIQTFPMVNNDMLRGLRYRQFLALKQAALPQVNTAAKESSHAKQGIPEYERRLHELEGKLAQSGLERRVLREDKDAVTAQLSEVRAKYRELFDNELSLRTELLACEQEKLALGKAFVAFQLERDEQVQQFDSDKFEAETRLLKAEQLIVEIQQDDATKAAQIQDLCAKMNELVAEKAKLGGELALLQKAAKDAEQTRDAEAKKNQQLSLELIVAVNQKQKLQSETEALATQLRAQQAKSDTEGNEFKQFRLDNEALRDQVSSLEMKLESMKKDVLRRELELERAELTVKREQLDAQQAGRDADQKRENFAKQQIDEMEAQRATFAADKRSLELQLERLRHDLSREAHEKQRAASALKTKSEENEELMLALERARHELQAQFETFRLKLALVHQPENSGDRVHETSAGVRALRELLTSYQQRERELREELDNTRNASLRMTRRLRYPIDSIDTRSSNNANDKESGEEESGNNNTRDIQHLREQLATAEQQVADEMKQRSDQVLVIAELEERIATLTSEQGTRLSHQQIVSNSSDDSGVRAMTEMHAALTRQLEEVRRLTLQQQQNQQSEQVASNAIPISQPKSPEQRADPTELESLRAAKAQLELRLSSNKAQWMTLLEQVERRCAELLTKNVMLTEDNESLRKHLVKARKTQL